MRQRVRCAHWSDKQHVSVQSPSNDCIHSTDPIAMTSKRPLPADDASNDPVQGVDDTPEYPLSAPIKPDDPERRSEQSRAETAGCVEEAPVTPNTPQTP